MKRFEQDDVKDFLLFAKEKGIAGFIQTTSAFDLMQEYCEAKDLQLRGFIMSLTFLRKRCLQFKRVRGVMFVEFPA